MPINKLHSFLVRPGKNVENPPSISGSEIPQQGKLFTMLKAIYDDSETDCTYDISFDPTEDGEQDNPCRTLITKYLKTRSISNGRTIATRLQQFTTNTPGMGLLFLLSGNEGTNKKIVLSRFPADSGILADEHEAELTVEYLEKVFMKSATAYKAAQFLGKSLSGDFWDGKAIDKQTNSNVLTISNYWIRDFLASDFRTTSAQGTRRLAVALVNATKKSDSLEDKSKIIAVCQLAHSVASKTISVSSFCKKFGLEGSVLERVKRELPNEETFTERFRFSKGEFSRHATYRTVELDNGAILSGRSEQFDNIFDKTVVDKPSHEVEYSTRGKVVDQKLRKSR